MTITTQNIQQYLGKNLFDDGGNKIGKIGAVFLDDTTGQPEWITVSTGFFGTNESFVPVADASAREDGLTVPYSKDKVKGAPNVDVDRGHLSSDEEEDLYRYYGLPDRTDAGRTDAERSDSERSSVGRTDLIQHDADHDDSDATGLSAGPTNRRGIPVGERSEDRADSSGPGDDAMTRSEERLNIGTETVTSGRARLRKWVETEHQQVDVPVRKEKVRLETEPIPDDDRP